jgi:hypothetical protein
MTSTDSLRDADVPALAAAAERFLAGQSWCGRVRQVTPIFAIRGVLGVFRCTLFPSHPDADVMVWVVVGDLPSAYLAHEPGDSWQDALRGYVEEMELWVDAVRAGRTVGGLIPVDTPATPHYAEMLASRLAFIHTRLLDVDPGSVESDV